MKKLATLALITVVGACSPPADTATDGAVTAVAASTVHDPVPLTAQQKSGQLIFETMCWTCHGSAGRGDGPAVAAGAVGTPPSFHTQDYATASVERLQGRFSVAFNEADPLHPHMQYVASLLKPERFADALSFIPALAYPAEIPGSALAGGRLYNFRCVGCHGPTGRGDGTAAAALINMAPADFTMDTLIAAGNWDALFQHVQEGGRAVHGSSMPPWGTVLADAEMWDLVAYLATFQPALLAEPHWMR